jgi:precorrin-2 methylase
VFFAVTDEWAAAWLRELNANSRSFDYPRDGRYRTEIYAAMVRDILAALDAGQNVCAVFYGSPSWLTQPARLAIHRAREHGFAARMLPGVSSVECLFADLAVDAASGGLTVFEATEYLKLERSIDPTVQLVLCQIALIDHRRTGDADVERIREGLRRLQHRLLRAYSRDHEAVVYEASSHPLLAPRITRIALGALEDCPVSELSTLYVPPITSARQSACSVPFEASPPREGRR